MDKLNALIVPAYLAHSQQNVPDAEVQLQASADNIEITSIKYFGYGKEMDVSYIDKKYHFTGNNAKSLGIARLPAHQWLIDSSSRFPIIVPSEEEHSVWGVVYELQLSAEELVTLESKAAKRGMVTTEVEVQMYQQAGHNGDVRNPFTPLPIDSPSMGTAKVTTMIGTLLPGQELGASDRKLTGSKRDKLNGGFMWAAYLGIPEEWKVATLRKHVDKQPDESTYWPGSRPFFETAEWKAFPNGGEAPIMRMVKEEVWTGLHSLKKEVRKSGGDSKGKEKERQVASDEEDQEGDMTAPKGKKRAGEEGQDEASVKRQRKLDKELAIDRTIKRRSKRGLTNEQIAEAENEEVILPKEMGGMAEESGAGKRGSRMRGSTGMGAAKKMPVEDEDEDEDEEDYEEMGGMGGKKTPQKEPKRKWIDTPDGGRREVFQRGAVWLDVALLDKPKKSAKKAKR